MKPTQIKMQLGNHYRISLVVSILLFALLALNMQQTPLGTLARGAAPLPLVLTGLVIWYSVRRLTNLNNHPDMVRLARYGPLSELLPAIDAELADERQLTRIGVSLVGWTWLHTGIPGELHHAEVLLTPTWLIYATEHGNRLAFFHLDRVVYAARLERGVILTDEYDERLTIPGTEAGVMRLMAEIMTRVPWILNHFDSDTERNWTENRQQIVAKVAQRRQQYQESHQGLAEERSPDELS